jgi:hypothetical protein
MHTKIKSNIGLYIVKHMLQNPILIESYTTRMKQIGVYDFYAVYTKT